MRIIYPILAAAAATLAAPAPVPAALGPVVVVNGTGSAISAVEMRKTGRSGWSPVALASPAGGAAAAAFDDSECAVDLRATLASGEQLLFSGVNPCGISRLTLRRDSGIAWVDYD
jgi:hypothetical protein